MRLGRAERDPEGPRDVGEGDLLLVAEQENLSLAVGELGQGVVQGLEALDRTRRGAPPSAAVRSIRLTQVAERFSDGLAIAASGRSALSLFPLQAIPPIPRPPLGMCNRHDIDGPPRPPIEDHEGKSMNEQSTGP